MGKEKETVETTKIGETKPSETTPPAGDGEVSATNELSAEKSAHEATKAELEAEKQAHEDTKASAKTIIDGLKGQLKSTEEKAEEGNSSVEVKHEKEVYTVAIHSFKLDGVEYTSADLKTNPALVAELVELKSGVLVKKQKV
ncbi:MAG: hypothetical protein WBP45_11080 [Daejeonella sp.]